MNYREIKKEIVRESRNFRKFVKFLLKRKLSGFGFLLTILLLLFLPAQGYYQTVQGIWQEPEVVLGDFILPLPIAYPRAVASNPPPEITARGVIIFDLPSAVTLFEKNSHTRFLPASTVKMMTALVALDYFTLDQILEVSQVSQEGQDIKLIDGERMTFENLLYAVLVASANDAAETLAANYPGGTQAFVAQMNKKAQQLSLKDTYFTNPIGLDDIHQYTSPFDLALLARSALLNPVFSQVVATRQKTIFDTTQEKAYELSNINQLLGAVPGVKGVKTGWTQEAGECLVTYIERENRKLVIVVLGSLDRFGETEKLINWAFENFEWK